MEESHWRSGQGGMRWAGLVTCVRENKNVCTLVGKCKKKKKDLECVNVGGRIVLKWILKK